MEQTAFQIHPEDNVATALTVLQPGETALLLDLGFRELGAETFRYGYDFDNIRSKKLAESFGFHYDRSYELTRPWDGTVKKIDSCLLTRAEYLGSGQA